MPPGGAIAGCRHGSDSPQPLPCQPAVIFWGIVVAPKNRQGYDTGVELKLRIADHEDNFTERKTESAGSTAWRRTLVAFANSVPEGRTASLVIGVSDDGAILGVTIPDSIQKTIRKICEQDCYPPIAFSSEVVAGEPGAVVVASVPFSAARPHFSGTLLLFGAARKVSRHRNRSSTNWSIRATAKPLGDPQVEGPGGDCDRPWASAGLDAARRYQGLSRGRRGPHSGVQCADGSLSDDQLFDSHDRAAGSRRDHIRRRKMETRAGLHGHLTPAA